MSRVGRKKTVRKGLIKATLSVGTIDEDVWNLILRSYLVYTGYIYIYIYIYISTNAYVTNQMLNW